MKLARALETAGGPKASASNLPLQNLEFGEQLERVDFRAGGKHWRFDPAAGSCIRP